MMRTALFCTLQHLLLFQTKTPSSFPSMSVPRPPVSCWIPVPPTVSYLPNSSLVPTSPLAHCPHPSLSAYLTEPHESSPSQISLNSRCLAPMEFRTCPRVSLSPLLMQLAMLFWALIG